MTSRPSKNKAASIRQRLLNQARSAKTDYNHLLVRYAIERLLYRLSASAHREAFILKGAMLFAVWRGTPHRATQDLDLLGFGERSETRLTHVFAELCDIAVEDDGIRFDAKSIRVEEIQAAEDYGGLRVMLNGNLGGARIPVQVDIGFGDAVTPAAAEENYPVLLNDLPGARLRTYPRETVVAEKLEAIASLGMLNTRFKDYYDLVFLAQNFMFDGALLAAAIANTFRRRGTAIPDGLPIGLTTTFADDPTKQTQWKAFKRRIGDESQPDSLNEIVTFIATFLGSPLESAARGGTAEAHWPAGGPWRSN